MLVSIYDRVGVFAPQYYGTVQYYATMATYARAIVDTALRYDKRFKSVHRCQIVDTRGPLTLTVPVSRPKDAPCRTWNQVTVASQAGWWSDHRVSLESAYGRTPFFEFYIDRFMPYLRDVNIPITEMDRGIDIVVRGILGLETEVTYGFGDDTAHSGPSGSLTAYSAPFDDYRKNNFPAIEFPPYYQVRAQQLGFHPNLSILDLIFNLGPESPIYIKNLLKPI